MDIKYCRHCGIEMRWEAKSQTYDRGTGEIILHGIVRCPNRRWFLDNHDQFNATKANGKIEIHPVADYF